MKIVISLGGSLLFGAGGKPDLEYIKKFSELIKGIGSAELIIITGGGRKAREYAKRVRDKTHNEFLADKEAIKATRENAKLLIEIIGKGAHNKVMESFDDAAAALKEGKIAIGGGMLEGLTTDAVSVLFAERYNASAVINAGDTEGIYSADPKGNKDAKKIANMTHSGLVELAIKNDSRKAGTNFVFDLVAAKLAARSNLELRFVNGRDLLQLKEAINGKEFKGTRVSD